MPFAWLVSALLVGAPESTPDRLHRRGVHCMDMIERDECAIENFEALLGEREASRAQASDALLRLLRLYGRAKDEDGIRQVLRRFWDVGMGRRSLGHMAYSARFFPPEIDVVVRGNASFVDAEIWSGLEFDVREFMLTCDPAKRQAILEAQWRRKAERRAQREQRPAEEVYQEDRARAAAGRSAYEQRNPPAATPDPIFVDGPCALSRALGATDLRPIATMTGGIHHADNTRSMIAFEIPDVREKLARAVSEQRLQPVRTDHFRIPGFQYAGHAVDLVQLDRDELVMVRQDMAEGLVLARKQGRTQLHQDIQHLIKGVPPDVDGFVVMTSKAATALGMQGMKETTRKFLEALLPKPKGVQIAVVASRQVGIFTRVPTDQAVQGRMIVGLAQAIVNRQGQKDPELEAWLRQLDLAQAKDGRALLASYLLTTAQLRAILE